jgi:hypothetical protein
MAIFDYFVVIALSTWIMEMNRSVPYQDANNRMSASSLASPSEWSNFGGDSVAAFAPPG